MEIKQQPLFLYKILILNGQVKMHVEFFNILNINFKI